MKLAEMREWLDKRGIQLTKSLGQNFLHDAHQLARIVEAAELGKADKVLEIGPGLGPLTELLLAQAGELLAIEKDARLVAVLRERFGSTLALTPTLSPGERENVMQARLGSESPDSVPRGNKDLPPHEPERRSPDRLDSNPDLQQADLEIGAPRGSGVQGANPRSENSLPTERAGMMEDVTPPSALHTPHFELLHDDALEFIRRERRDWRDWKLVANLPYSVASPILVELAQSPQRPKQMTVTLQLEVAQRLMAQADDDDYGVLTLLIQLDYEPRGWFKIPASCFFPSPDVDSACVTLVRREKPLLADEQRAAFVKIVKRAFSQRRKMMLKLLKTEWPPDKLERAFAELRISLQERAEKLNLEQFVGLTNLLNS